MKRKVHTASSERGAVLVHVALALIALMAFSTFVIDYGVFWTARRQAQNAADAAALAGAVALAFDDFTDRTDSGPAKRSAYSVLDSHYIWGDKPVVNITTDITFPECPDDGTDNCVQVYVYRNTARGTALPTFFGKLVGINQQGLRAMAVAKVATATATDCLKPWGVIDRWREHYPINPGTYNVNTSTFDKYLSTGPNAGQIDPAIPVPDYYEAATAAGVGTGFYPFNPNMTLSADYGLQINLTVGDQNNFQFATGWFAPLALVDSRGGNDYSNNIKGCVGTTYSIGQAIEVETEPGKKVGPTEQAVESDIDSIINKDSGAVWDPTLNGGLGGVANSAYGISPRIVPVPLVSPDIMAAFLKGGRTTVIISNIMGFFVEGYDNSTKSVIGRLVTTVGLLKVGTGSTIGSQSGFMRAIILIR
jgi:Flp pilus assembly protein TadG